MQRFCIAIVAVTIAALLFRGSLAGVNVMYRFADHHPAVVAVAEHWIKIVSPLVVTLGAIPTIYRNARNGHKDAAAEDDFKSVLKARSRAAFRH